MGKKSRKSRLTKSNVPTISKEHARASLICGSIALVLTILNIPGLQAILLPNINLNPWFMIVIIIITAILGLHLAPKEELRGKENHIRMARKSRLFSWISLGYLAVSLILLLIFGLAMMFTF